jgi:hypothetical protein
MVRFCLSIFLFQVILSGCTGQQTQDTANVPKQVNGETKENILACLGIPVAGQKCGLAVPDVTSR